MDNAEQRIGASGIGDPGPEIAEPTLRAQVVAEIMKLVRPEPKPLERPTIEELEKLLNSETTDAVNINPDGSISTRPTTTTVGAVTEAVLRVAETAISREREACANIALAIDSNRGNEKEIARAIRARAHAKATQEG